MSDAISYIERTPTHDNAIREDGSVAMTWCHYGHFPDHDGVPVRWRDLPPSDADDPEDVDGILDAGDDDEDVWDGDIPQRPLIGSEGGAIPWDQLFELGSDS